MNTKRTKTSETRDVGATVLGHLLGWPLYAFGLFLWGATVIPALADQARNAPPSDLDQGLAGLGTGACLVVSGLGLLLIAAAVGKRHYGFQWALVALYGIALFFGLVVTSN